MDDLTLMKAKVDKLERLLDRSIVVISLLIDDLVELEVISQLERAALTRQLNYDK